MIAIHVGKKKAVSQLAFVPGSRLIVADVAGLMVGVWDIDGGGPPRHSLGMRQPVYALGVVPGVAFLTAWGRALRWDFTSDTAVPIPGDPQLTPTLRLSPDGSRLLVGRGGVTKSPAARVELWDVTGETPRMLWRSPTPVAFVAKLAFLPCGDRFLARTDATHAAGEFVAGSLADGTWDGPPVAFDAGESFAPLTLSTDGNRLFSLAAASVYVRDRRTGELVTRIKNPDGITHFGGLALHPSGAFFATANLGGPVRFWDAATFAPIARFDWSLGKARCVAFSPDGLLCAAGGDKGQIVVWDVD